jgi:carboxyl-terminal processing protease
MKKTRKTVFASAALFILSAALARPVLADGPDAPGFVEKFESSPLLASIDERQRVGARLVEGVPVASVPAFHKSTPSQIGLVLRIMSELGMRGLVLDLRFCPGGDLSAAVRVSAMLAKGDLCSVLMYGNGLGNPPSAIKLYRSGPARRPVQTAVLANSFTASSAELVAAAIQESGGGVVVGAPTFGKSSIQLVSIQDDCSALLETKAKYLTPSGKDVGGKGLRPDIAELGSEEAQMAAALEYLRDVS